MSISVRFSLRLACWGGLVALALLLGACGGEKKSTGNGSLDAVSDAGSDLSTPGDATIADDAAPTDTSADDATLADDSEQERYLPDGALNCEAATIQAGAELPTSPDLKITGDKQLLNYVYQGENRPYILRLPAGYDGSSELPVIFAFHGGGSDALTFYDQTFRLVNRADKDQLILVYPQGIWGIWNGVGCCYAGVKCDFDDIGYLRELVGHLRSVLAVNAKRIHALGYSNGGYFSHRVAAELSDLFAAVAVVAGSIGGNYPGDALQTISAVSPMPMIMCHGNHDSNVVFGGGTTGGQSDSELGRYVVSFADSVTYWVAFDKCDQTPTTQTSGKVTIRTFGNCTAGTEVVALVVDGHGHEWPHMNDTDQFDVIAAFLTFFQKHPKP